MRYSSAFAASCIISGVPSIRTGTCSISSCRAGAAKQLPFRTEVCLTVDTEFSIGGAFAHPARLRPVGEPHVYCPVNGEDHGLPFILRTLARFGFPATFFVETLNIAYFGDTPLCRVVDKILAAGQDLQLHGPPKLAAFPLPRLGRSTIDRPPQRPLFWAVFAGNLAR